MIEIPESVEDAAASPLPPPRPASGFPEICRPAFRESLPRMTIRTLIVDDEKLAIQGLQVRLEPFDDVEIDTCQNGRGDPRD